jgi:spermidine synthase
VACFFLIAVPAICAGLSFPVILDYAETRSRPLGAAVGRLYAVNTAGTIAGALVTGFVVLGWLGGRKALFVSAGLSLAVAVPLWPRRLVALAVAAGVWVAGVLLAPDWDVKALLSGANVYFARAHDDVDEVVWQHEDYIGGVTSVVRSGRTLTMLTNGKFQGNNASEVRDQIRFSLIPNLYVRHPRRALNIGLGTGTTLGAISRFPYAHIDVVELSADIVTAAERYFADVNRGALHAPNVAVHIDDGRSFLATRPLDRAYDLVSVEITSIWFAGAGNLYNDEFYAAAKRRMAPDGVFQQWIQLHHIDAADIAVVLATMRRHFAHVALWLPGHQGIVIASDAPLEVQPGRLAEMVAQFPADDFEYGQRGTLFGELLLVDKEVDAFLAKARPRQLSTDRNLYLEYSTPKGNALGWNFQANFDALARFAHHGADDVLPPALRKDPEARALFLLGQLHFLEPYSRAWHEQIERALELLPTAEARRRLKAGVIAATRPH